MCLFSKQLKCEDFYPQGFAGLLDLEPASGLPSEAFFGALRGGSWFGKQAAGEVKQQLEVVITDSEVRHLDLLFKRCE